MCFCVRVVHHRLPLSILALKKQPFSQCQCCNTPPPPPPPNNNQPEIICLTLEVLSSQLAALLLFIATPTLTKIAAEKNIFKSVKINSSA